MYPRVPGHEVVGVIDEAGAGVTEWKKGDRVGVGWHGGHDFGCPSCRRGDFVTCANEAITASPAMAAMPSTCWRGMRRGGRFPGGSMGGGEERWCCAGTRPSKKAEGRVGG